MSLRLRLVLLTLALVALVALVLSALQVQSLVDSLLKNAIDRAQLAGDQVTDLVIERITVRLSTSATSTPATSATSIIENEGPRELWTRIVVTDPEIRGLIRKVMTRDYFSQLLQINIVDTSGKILVSYPENATAPHPVQFSDWRVRPWYVRAWDLFESHADWQVFASRPIGLGDEAVFRVQVLTSSLLLRDELRDPLQTLFFVSLTAVGVALVVALLATHSALRPLHRIERTIDRITQGSFQADEPDSPLAKEFQVMESKLHLLGERMQGVGDALPNSTLSSTQDKLDILVERVASQLDVAQRLSAISRLSGGVAHEIKNPLNAISLRLDLLKVRLGDSGEEVNAELEILSKEVMRLNRVVTTFLDFSRPVEVNFEEVDLAGLASEVAELIRPQAAISNIDVQCVLPDSPVSMRGDPDLLKQAILNLVTNAIEAMGSTGGSLRIIVDREGGNLVLRITDTGPGIPPDLRDKVFQLYFTSKAKGSGIGLAMTYRAAQLHNGTIDFASESGVGTTFRLEFPASVTHA